MSDLFYAIVILWVLWKIFGGVSRQYVTHRHRYEKPPEKNQDDVTITHMPSSGQQQGKDQGEYVDFEEVK